MLSFLKRLYYKAINLGIDENVEYLEAIKIKMLNQQTIIVLILVFYYFLQAIFVEQSDIFVSFAFFGLVGVLLVFNNYKLFIVARIYWTIFFPVLLVCVSYLYGEDLRMEYAFIHFILSILIFFESIWTRIFVSFFVFIAFLASIWITENLESPYAYAVYPFDKIMLFLFSGICTANIITVVFEGMKRNNVKLTNHEKELTIKNKELERFAYIASHDLKQPVQNIINFSHLIQEFIDKKAYKEVEEFSEIIESNAKQMNTLIVDTLELVKEETIKIEYYNVNEIIKDIKQLLIETLAKRNARIEVLRPLPNILGNYSELFSCFKNLIENGIKYNDKSKPKVSIDVLKQSNSVDFIVKDNGQGIPEDYHEYIFEMYNRLNPRSQISGTGLGLSMVKKVIDRMGGSIRVESKINEGSSFIISLPFSKVKF